MELKAKKRILHPDTQEKRATLYIPSSAKTFHDESPTANDENNIDSPPVNTGNESSIENIKEEPKKERLRKPYKRPARRTYNEMEEKVEVLMPDAEELKGAKFVRSEKTCRLYMIPAKIVKVIYDRKIYAKDGKLIIPHLPYVPENLQKRHIEPSLMAGILTNKFCYHIPIHRQLVMLRNAGADIARSTLYDWCSEGIDALEWLYQTIRDEVLKAEYLNIVETTVAIISENVHHTKKEYMWGLVDTKNKLAFFDYDQGSRSRSVINNILQNYIGTIQSDGYSAYKKIGIEDKKQKINRRSPVLHIFEGNSKKVIVMIPNIQKKRWILSTRYTG